MMIGGKSRAFGSHLSYSGFILGLVEFLGYDRPGASRSRDACRAGWEAL